MAETKAAIPAPKLQPATYVTRSSFRINWTPVAKADSYEVCVAEDAKFKNPVAGWVKKNVGKMDEVEVLGLQASQSYDEDQKKKYFVRVYAVCHGDFKDERDRDWSASSNVVVVTMKF